MNSDTLDRYFLEGFRPYLWIAAIIALLYARSLAYTYTYLDDNALILNNIGFLKDLSNAGAAFLQKVFAKSYLPYYRPLLTLSFMIDAQAGGASLVMYHVTNIIFHIAASCLVFLFLVRLGYDRLPSFLLGMIFAVHPVLSQGVAWIPGRNDTMMAVFVLASFIALVGMLGSGRPAYYLAHLAFFLLAIFTKETALVLVPACLMYLFLIARERIFSRACLMCALGWGACALVWYMLRSAAVRGSMELTIVEAWRILLTYLPASVQFMGKIFFPVNLSVFPIMQDTTYVYGAISIGVIFLLLLATRKRRYGFIVFGIAWAVFFLLPALMRANYRISADFLEHRVYVPIIGVFILLLETDLVKNMKRPVMVTAAVIAIAGCAALTFMHIDNFRDKDAFWSNAVLTSPHSPFAHMAMGNVDYDNGRLDSAADEYKKALALDPLEPGSWYGLGRVYSRKDMLKDAGPAFKKSIALYPYDGNAWVELGVIFYKQGDRKNAESAWLAALKIAPDNIEANKFLAIFYKEQNDYEKAQRHALKLRQIVTEPPAAFMKSIGAK